MYIVLCFIVTMAVKSARDMVWLLSYIRNYACVLHDTAWMSWIFRAEYKKNCKKKWRLPLCCYLVRYKQLRGSLLSIDTIVSGIIFKHQNTVMFISWGKNLEHKFIFPNPVHV